MSGAVFIDLSKAFDTISHYGLLSKLPFCGICDTELKSLRITYFFESKLFTIMAFFQNPTPFLQGFYKGASLVHCCSLFILTMLINLFSRLELLRTPIKQLFLLLQATLTISKGTLITTSTLCQLGSARMN